MTSYTAYMVCAAFLFAVGAWGSFTAEHFIRRILALNIMGAGVFLVLIALASRSLPAGPDPVPHAMVLTGIVVAVSATALALSLVRKVHEDQNATPPKPEADH